tara:strand:- start:1253 stop:1933 length:681 start_codon:yes stop_codon:yes gene_type:complete
MTFGQPPASNGLSLNLSQTGAPLTNGGSGMMNGFSNTVGHQAYNAPSSGWYNQPQQQQPSMMGAMFSGAMGQDPYNPQPIMPPSDTEILMTMLDNSYPVERFLASPLFGSLLDIMGAITTFSVLNIVKNASYNFDEENGVFTLDPTSLPQEMQTMSAENIMAQVTGLNNQLSQLIGHADQIKQQTLQNAGNSMLQAQLANAMNNPGMMTSAAEGTGSFLRGMLSSR